MGNDGLFDSSFTIDTTPNWDLWSNITKGSLHELVALSLDLDPSIQPPIQYKRALNERRMLIARELRPIFENPPDFMDCNEYYVADFRGWAESLSPAWDLPPKFPRGTANSKKTKSISELQNDCMLPITLNIQDHPCYSEELAIAVEAWSELFAHSDGKAPGKAPKKIIGDWLKSNYPKLGPGAIERISVLINPFKSGGATPTQ